MVDGAKGYAPVTERGSRNVSVVCDDSKYRGLGIIYKYFLALARTRASNTLLRIGVCAV